LKNLTLITDDYCQPLGIKLFYRLLWVYQNLQIRCMRGKNSETRNIRVYDRRDLYGYGIIYIIYRTETLFLLRILYYIYTVYSLDWRYRSSEQIAVVSTFPHGRPVTPVRNLFRILLHTPIY